MSAKPTLSARLAVQLGIAWPISCLSGVGLAHFGAVSSRVGFALFALGGLLALIAMVVGVVAVVRTREGSGRLGRKHAFLGMALGDAGIILFVVLAVGGRGAPRINDVTTNLDDPPAFVLLANDPDNAGRDMAYPGEFAAEHARGYSELKSIELSVEPDAALAKAEQAASELGWHVLKAPEPGADGTRTLEATSTTKLFRFTDDIVVRIRKSDNGATVDVRSKSRVGKGDMGANAARIRAFTERLEI